MTGLDEKIDSILEIAVIITDIEFNVLEEYHRVVFQPQSVVDNMNSWCKKTHGGSGLTAAVAHGTPLSTVQNDLLAIIQRRYSEKDQIVIAGNSVNNDRRFVDKYLPELAKRLHYRQVDVTSYKEIFREKYGVIFQKANAHRAIDDIYESIRELKFYLSYVNIQRETAKPSASTQPNK